jgi:hypothetical protein
MARARSAKEKQAISQGLKEFWDDKGRTVLKVGGAGLAVGGALTLAAKSGKLPKGLGKKGMRNGHKAPMKMLPPGKSGTTAKDLIMDDLAKLGQDRISPRMLPGASEMGTGNAMVLANPRGIRDASREIFQRGRKLSNDVIETGRATRAGFDEGYATASTEKGLSYFLGRQAAKADRKGKEGVNKMAAALKRRLENRG